MTYAARGEQTHSKKGVAIIIKEHLAQYITKETIDPQGHFISLTLEGFPGTSSHKLLISSVYMPTNIDRLGREDPTFILATNIHNTLIEQAKNHDTAIICGDFNETRTQELDLFKGLHDTARNNTHPGRIIDRTIKQGLTDVFRNLHPTKEGHTHSQTTATASTTPTTQSTPTTDDGKRTSTARLDYILAKNITPLTAEVGIQKNINSDHHPLTATLNFTIQLNNKHGYQRPSLRTKDISDEDRERFANSLARKLEKERRKRKPPSLHRIQTLARKLGINVVGLKQRKKPSQHNKQTTTTGRLLKDIATLQYAITLLRSKTNKPSEKKMSASLSDLCPQLSHGRANTQEKQTRLEAVTQLKLTLEAQLDKDRDDLRTKHTRQTPTLTAQRYRNHNACTERT
jgi:exonuclease III